jgi:hypothetical protein
LEEDVEVGEDFEAAEMMRQGQISVIIVIRRDISLDIVLLQDDLGVPTV